MLKKLLIIIYVGFILSCGKAVSKKENYVVLSPEVAEIISLLEGTENISGVTLECDFPPDLKIKPKVGTFGQIDIEKLITLNPDIVFASGLEQNAIKTELAKLNIETISIYPKSISDFLSSVRKIGFAIGRQERANFVADSLENKINLLTKKTVHKSKQRVYVEIYGNPIMSVSDSSFVGELIELAGANNIFSELPRDYSRVNPEKIIEADPQIIITTCPGMTPEQIRNRKGWEVISAVENNRIYTVDDINPDLILRASPRIIKGITQLQSIFHETNK